MPHSDVFHSIWAVVTENSREGFLQAATSFGIDAYEAEEFHRSIKDDFQEKSLSGSSQLRLELAIVKSAMTIDVENEDRVRRLVTEYRLWLGSKGLVESIGTIIQRMLAEELDYQTYIYLGRRQKQVLRPIPKEPSMAAAATA